MNRREDALNTLLGGAWDKYVQALDQGEVRELEQEYESFISGIVDGVVTPPEVEDGSEVD